MKMRKLYVTGGAGDGIPLRTSLFGMLRDAGGRRRCRLFPKGRRHEYFCLPGAVDARKWAKSAARSLAGNRICSLAI
ncbi:MAG: hypothetical protein WCF02_01795 [Azonexus sp.]